MRHVIDVVFRNLAVGFQSDLLRLRTVIVNDAVVVINVGYVPRVIDDGYILAIRREGANIAGVVPSVPGNEAITARSDPPVRIAPTAYADSDRDTPTFRGKRRPAAIIFRVAPRNPGRRPFMARYPDPSFAIDKNPAPIMIGCPAETLVGVPIPSPVSIVPMAIRVGMPVRSTDRNLRLKDVTVRVIVIPLAVIRQLVVEDIITVFVTRSVFLEDVMIS